MGQRIRVNTTSHDIGTWGRGMSVEVRKPCRLLLSPWFISINYDLHTKYSCPAALGTSRIIEVVLASMVDGISGDSQ